MSIPVQKSDPFLDLTANALDFLEESVRQLRDQPKFSAIHFYTAVELFLKARLVHEHWSLAVSNPSDASRSKFLEADFVSIGLEDTLTRLENILPNDPIPMAEKDRYELLRKRRNKAIHFYHPEFHATEEPRVAIEQLQAWRHLHLRLTKNWKDLFEGCHERLQRLHSTISRYQDYYPSLFEEYWAAQSNRIAQAKKNPKKRIPAIGFCPYCEQRALEARGKLADDIFIGECQVCDRQTPLPIVECGCGSRAAISPWEDLVCLACDRLMGKSDRTRLAAAFDHVSKEECGYCDACGIVSEPSVVPIQNTDGISASVCLECLQGETPNGIASCDWCGEHVVGNRGDYANPGCAMCQVAIEAENGEDTEDVPVTLEEWIENQEPFELGHRSFDVLRWQHSNERMKREMT